MNSTTTMDTRTTARENFIEEIKIKVACGTREPYLVEMY